MLPASIVIAALLIAVGLVYNAGKKSVDADKLAANAKNTQGTEQVGDPKNMKPVSADDHILGDPNAPVKLVVYSDLECPYCKVFHEGVVAKISADYGNKVAVVFRHFPIPSLHSKAPNEAVAAECAASLGGNDAFWGFVNKVFAITPSNNGLDPAELPKIATGLGLDGAKFSTCLHGTSFEAKINANIQDGISSGVQGTPYSVVVAPTGAMFPISGAYPYDYVKQVLDKALALKK